MRDLFPLSVLDAHSNILGCITPPYHAIPSIWNTDLAESAHCRSPIESVTVLLVLTTKLKRVGDLADERILQRLSVVVNPSFVFPGNVITLDTYFDKLYAFFHYAGLIGVLDVIEFFL